MSLAGDTPNGNLVELYILNWHSKAVRYDDLPLICLVFLSFASKYASSETSQFFCFFSLPCVRLAAFYF